MYRPDPTILRQLQESDPDLDVRWDRDKERWVVTCQGKDCIVVRNEDNSYRPLDGRIVTRMREEAWKYRQYYGAFHMLDSELFHRNRALEQAARARQQDDFRQYMVEEGHQAVFGVGKFAGWGPGARA